MDVLSFDKEEKTAISYSLELTSFQLVNFENSKKFIQS